MTTNTHIIHHHPFIKRPPKKVRQTNFKNAQKTRVYLQDEAPVIGCGWRLIWFKRQRKWGYLCDMQGNIARLKLAVFDQLKLQE